MGLGGRFKWKGIGNAIRSTAGGVGDVAKVALPVAAFIPGVNLGVGALAGLGAAAGAMGTLNDKGASWKDALGNAAVGAGSAAAAGALAPAKAAASPLSMAGKTATMMGGVNPVAAAPSVGSVVAGAAPAAAKAAGGLFGGMSGMEKIFLLTQGLGTLADMYGAYQQGQREDEDIRRKRERDAAIAPLMADLFHDVGS